MAKLPKKFKWLNEIGTLPRLLSEGLRFLDLKELPGTKNNNPVIMQWAKDLGVSDIYVNDEVSWCALGMSKICVLAGKPMPFKRYEIVRAASFLKWGNEVPIEEAQCGDVLVFSRIGGNHVALYVAETPNTFWVYGFNQSNKAGFTEIEKKRCRGARRYYAIGAPASAKKYFMGTSGKVSTNEA